MLGLLGILPQVLGAKGDVFDYGRGEELFFRKLKNIPYPAVDVNQILLAVWESMVKSPTWIDPLVGKIRASTICISVDLPLPV